MIGIGIVLLAIGAVLIVAASMVAQIPAGLGSLGWLLAVVGLVLIVVGVLVEETEVALLGGGVAMAAARPGGGFRAPADPDFATVDPPVSARQPVLIGFVVGAIPLFAAALAALAEIFTGMPDWIVPTFTVIGTLTTGLAALWAKQRVTPTADPKLDDGTPLVPEVRR